MATITLDYNKRNVQARNALEYILSMGVFRTQTAGKPRKNVTFTDFRLTSPDKYKFNREEANER